MGTNRDSFCFQSLAARGPVSLGFLDTGSGFIGLLPTWWPIMLVRPSLANCDWRFNPRQAAKSQLLYNEQWDCDCVANLFDGFAVDEVAEFAMAVGGHDDELDLVLPGGTDDFVGGSIRVIDQ